MKAAVVVANEDVQYLEIPEPEVKPGYVKIKVHYSGICGSDIPRVLHNGVHFYPIVLGHEFSGDVVEIGEGVTKVKAGDRVSGAPLVPCMKCEDCQKGNYSLCKHYSFIGSREQGSNADYVVIPEQNAVVYDSSISYEQAAMFEPSTVALHGLLQNEYQGGQYVAVLGGGTIGMFTMQWAKIFGSRKVVVFDISEERLELAKRLGADAVINTTKENYMQEAMALTGKKGYGYVFETAGQIPTMHMAFELAGNKANVCSYAMKLATPNWLGGEPVTAYAILNDCVLQKDAPEDQVKAFEALEKRMSAEDLRKAQNLNGADAIEVIKTRRVYLTGK